MRPPCSVPGCDHPRKAHGWCSTHYMRYRRTGSTDGPPRAMTVAARLALYVTYPDGVLGCWCWTGSLAHGGYGLAVRDGVKITVHRLAWEHYRGAIPAGLVIDHRCRRRACFNPWHLEVVTDAENKLRGLSGFALTGRCRSGLHVIAGPADWYVHPGNGHRECRRCHEERNARRGTT